MQEWKWGKYITASSSCVRQASVKKSKPSKNLVIVAGENQDRYIMYAQTRWLRVLRNKKSIVLQLQWIKSEMK